MVGVQGDGSGDCTLGERRRKIRVLIKVRFKIRIMRDDYMGESENRYGLLGLGLEWT